MRVIAGKYRGKVLSEFKGRDIRPTADRAKEALFNILQLKIVGARFLDLFCGTGSIGIEAISRGADKVVFVDNSKESAKLTEKNLTSIRESAKVVLSDALSYVLSADEQFDVIFLDPPYRLDVKDVLEEIAKNNILKENGVIVYEHTGESVAEIKGLELFDSRKYGIAVIDFYRR